MEFTLSFAFEKSDATGRYVRGFASVIERNGEPVVDTQGDLVEMEDLLKAAHRFVKDMRVGKVLHDGKQVGHVVESVLIDDEFVKSLDIRDSRRGWWIGMEVDDPAIQKRVASGELRAFSIGGRGKRTPMEA